jgi:effector-binding domain-containing protein
MPAITTVEVPATQILSLRERVPLDDFPTFIGRSFGMLYEAVGRLGIQAEGHPFVIYHAFGPDGADAEVCVPVAGEPVAGPPLRTRRLEPVTVARTLHVGPYDQLPATYDELAGWVAAHGLEPAGPVRERYLDGPADDVPPSAYRTEIEQPVHVVAVTATR